MTRTVVFYKGEELSDEYLTLHIQELITLMQQNHVTKKDVVLCHADTHLGTYLQWIACCEMKLLPIFLFSEYSLESIEHLKSSINFKAILSMQGINARVIINEDYHKSILDLSQVEEGSVIHLTSASTGNPKLVLRTRTQLLTEIERYCKYLKIDENDAILPIVPLSHSFGFISGMLLSLHTKAKLVLPDILLPRPIIQLSNIRKTTIMLGLPYFYKKMLSVSPNYNLNKELRYIIASGGPMEIGLQKNFMRDLIKKFFNNMGLQKQAACALI